MNAADKRLQSIVDRIERLDEEQKALGGDKRDIFSEAKSHGYNPKVLRRLIRERKRDTAEQAAEDAELETYRVALGMAVELVAGGVSLRKAAKAAGVSKSSVHRALAVPAVSHDPATGEVIEDEEVVTSGVAPAERSEPSPPAEQSVNPAPPLERVSLGMTGGEGERAGTHSDDGLTLPAFLDRRVAA